MRDVNKLAETVSRGINSVLIEVERTVERSACKCDGTSGRRSVRVLGSPIVVCRLIGSPIDGCRLYRCVERPTFVGLTVALSPVTPGTVV